MRGVAVEVPSLAPCLSPCSRWLLAAVRADKLRSAGADGLGAVWGWGSPLQGYRRFSAIDARPVMYRDLGRVSEMAPARSEEQRDQTGVGNNEDIGRDAMS